MITLIESVTTRNSFLKPMRRIIVDNKTIVGMKVMIVTIPIPAKVKAGRRERLKRSVLEFLRKLRVNTVCIRTDFQYPEWFEGFRKPTGQELVSELLSEYAVKKAEKHDSAYVFINRANSRSIKAVSELCEGFQTVCLKVENGSCNQIRESILRGCGASIITEPTEERIYAADAAIFFDRPKEMPNLNKTCVIVSVDSLKIRVVSENGTDAEIPDGYSQKALISEAILRGYIRFEDVQTV